MRIFGHAQSLTKQSDAHLDVCQVEKQEKGRSWSGLVLKKNWGDVIGVHHVLVHCACHEPLFSSCEQFLYQMFSFVRR
jgi:hypothetical protein